jgi:hypothetical protein
MKKVITIMCLCFACSVVRGSEPNQPADVNVPEKYVSLRALGEIDMSNPNAEVWLGFGKEQSEAGVIVGYRVIGMETDREEEITVGLFGMYHLPDLRDLGEEILWPIEWLPTGIKAQPAVGLKISTPINDNAFKALEIAPVLELTIFKNIALQYVRPFTVGSVEIETNEYVGLSWVWNF